MWQSHALAGALSLGASVPDEYGTCCALALRMPRLLAAAVIASTLAAFIKSRRSVEIDSMDVLPRPGGDEGSWLSLPPSRQASIVRCSDKMSANNSIPIFCLCRATRAPGQ